MELYGAAREIVMNMVPANINVVGVRTEINRVVKLLRHRSCAGIVHFIPIKPYAAGLARFHASHLAIAPGTFNVIANNLPSRTAHINGLLAADDMQLRNHPRVLTRRT